jgi:hypothetical protein
MPPAGGTHAPGHKASCTSEVKEQGSGMKPGGDMMLELPPPYTANWLPGKSHADCSTFHQPEEAGLMAGRLHAALLHTHKAQVATTLVRLTCWDGSG